MKFETPQKDIDAMLAVEKSVLPAEMPLYLDCMNNRTLSERIANPKKTFDEGRDVRDGCILVGVFMRCRPPKT